MSSEQPAAPTPETPATPPTPAPPAVVPQNQDGPRPQPAGPRPAGPRPEGGPRPAGAGPRGPKPIPEKWQKGGKPQGDKPDPDAQVKREFSAFKPNKRELDASIEAELAAAMAGTDLKSLTVEQPKPQSTGSGEGGRKKGRVLSIHGKDVFVDVPGGRSQGVIDVNEFEGSPPAVGDEIEFNIDRYDGANGLLVLTREGAAKQVTDWSSISFGMIVEARLTGMNKNSTGYTVEVNGIRGFMPVGQADIRRIEQPETLVNQKLKVQIIELDPVERNLVVSRRSLLEAERKRKEAEFWAGLEEGQVRSGVVSSVRPFGAFVDLGGADGLIPIGELSWQRVGTAEEIVKVGQTVDVKIMRLDHEAKKIGLSLRALHGNPWDDFANANRPGTRITGKVTRIAEFGAFVELTPGVEGLIHVSELSTGRVRKVRDAVHEGQTVDVIILTIDTDARRIGLSLKGVLAEKEAAEAAQAQAQATADRQEAAERMAVRKPSGKLRGGIGGGAIRFEIE